MSLAMTSKHGTYAGYMEHMREGGAPCSECRAAASEYMQSYRINQKLDAGWELVATHTSDQHDMVVLRHPNKGLTAHRVRRFAE